VRISLLTPKGLPDKEHETWAIKAKTKKAIVKTKRNPN
jgi:hypothetical protein